jgi:hypothetical protein
MIIKIQIINNGIYIDVIPLVILFEDSFDSGEYRTPNKTAA